MYIEYLLWHYVHIRKYRLLKEIYLKRNWRNIFKNIFRSVYKKLLLGILSENLIAYPENAVEMAEIRYRKTMGFIFS